MAFNSLIFLLFFSAVFFIHRLPLSWKAKKTNLLIASYIFYSAWNPVYVVLIWISTAVDWLVAGRMPGTKGPTRRRLLLLTSLIVNLGLLSYFKYGTFFLDNFIKFLAFFNIEFRAAAPDIVLPIGISFYTFQSISYTIEVYRGKIKPWGSFLDFALFVTFFPQLVAGPIVRASHFLPQCLKPRKATPRQLAWGFSLLTVGIFQKEILADLLIAPVVDKVYSAAAQVGFLGAWIGTLGFSAQIFFDFAGYSTCAIGVGMCLGFALPDNFHFPYASIGFRDFWRRWHISLSTWLRDYLYIPLGGNRKGRGRTQVNMLITMLLGGLWHGASWRFVAWGGLHGLYIILERIIRHFWGDLALTKKLPVRILLCLLTYLLVCVAWVFFRSPDIGSAFHLVAVMFVGGINELALSEFEIAGVLLVTAFLLTSHWMLRDSNLEEAVSRIPWWLVAVMLSGMLFTLILQPGDNRAFIYFQF